MAINNNLLRKKIKKVEGEFECALSIDKTKILIKKVQKQYKCSQKKRFKSLVEQLVEEMGLSYNYCRLMFSYFGSSSSKKNNKYKKEKREKHQQMFFNFYNPPPIVRY